MNGLFPGPLPPMHERAGPEHRVQAEAARVLLHIVVILGESSVTKGVRAPRAAR